MDRTVMLGLRLAVQARANLAEMLRDAPHDRDFPQLLLEVRDSGLFSVPELAEIVGLGRSRTYKLIAVAEEERREDEARRRAEGSE